MEADLVIAGGAASVVQVALGVSSRNGGRRPYGGVQDLHWEWGSGTLRGGFGWTSVLSGSTSTGLSCGAGTPPGLVGGGVQDSLYSELSATHNRWSTRKERPGHSKGCL